MADADTPDTQTSAAGGADDATGDERLDRLEASVCLRYRQVPEELRARLRPLLAAALSAADAAEPEVVQVINPTLRPQRLRLHAVATDRSQDRMYQQEWCEVAVAANGHLYLIYRRLDGAHHATRYDGGVTLPATMAAVLPEPLAEALLGGDG